MDTLKIIKYLMVINFLLSAFIGYQNYVTNKYNSDIFENLISITDEQINISCKLASSTQKSIELLAFYNMVVSQRSTLDENGLREIENEFNTKIQDYNNDNIRLNNYLNNTSNKIEARMDSIIEFKKGRANGGKLISYLIIFIAIISSFILYLEASSQNDLVILSKKLDEIKNSLSGNEAQYENSDAFDPIQLQIKGDVKIFFFKK